MLHKKQEKSHSFKCLECDYSTSSKSNITRHKQCHQRNGKFKCRYCSFSSNFRSTIALHFKRSHRQKLNSLEIPARIQVNICFNSVIVWSYTLPHHCFRRCRRKRDLEYGSALKNAEWCWIKSSHYPSMVALVNS